MRPAGGGAGPKLGVGCGWRSAAELLRPTPQLLRPPRKLWRWTPRRRPPWRAGSRPAVWSADPAVAGCSPWWRHAGHSKAFIAVASAGTAAEGSRRSSGRSLPGPVDPLLKTVPHKLYPLPRNLPRTGNFGESRGDNTSWTILRHRKGLRRYCLSRRKLQDSVRADSSPAPRNIPCPAAQVRLRLSVVQRHVFASTASRPLRRP